VEDKDTFQIREDGIVALRILPTASEETRWGVADESDKTLIGSISSYAPDLLYSMSSRLASEAVSPNALGFILQRIIWRSERWSKPRQAWVLALLNV
jgi:hypothetical protein